MVAVEDPRPPGGGARELDRALNGLGARVGEDHPLYARVCPLHQFLGQHAGKEGAVHLHQVRQVGVERIVQRLHDGGMAAAEGEHPEARQEVQVALPLFVDEVAALPPHVEPVELNGAEHPAELRVDVLGMEGEILALVLVQHLVQVKGHAGCSKRPSPLVGRLRLVGPVYTTG